MIWYEESGFVTKVRKDDLLSLQPNIYILTFKYITNNLNLYSLIYTYFQFYGSYPAFV